MVSKVVILAGGLGSRLSEETETKPKPMVEIGGRPIIWHIMKIYSAFNLNHFIICLGYKGYIIKEYFANYHLHMTDATFNIADSTMEVHNSRAEPWKVTLIDTGVETQTGGRIKRVRDHIGDETFCMTYGDGLADVNVRELIAHHKDYGRLATVTAVRPPGRFGALNLIEGRVHKFQEKPLGDSGWINGGFFVLSPDVFDYIDGDETVWESDPLERLAKEGQLGAFPHDGFWHPMDTLRDKKHLQKLWEDGNAPWKVW